jgi:hypothetical protein
MLSEHWNDHGGIFHRPPAFVNGRGIGWRQRVGLTESVRDGPAIEANNDLARVGVNIVDGALLNRAKRTD